MDISMTGADISDNGRDSYFGDALKEDVFQLWAFKCGRSAVKVSALMALPEYGEVSINERTIRRWAASDQWATLAAERIRAIAPSINETDAGELLVMRASALSYLRSVIDGNEDRVDVSAIDPADFLDRDGLPDAGALDRAITAAVKAHSDARKAKIQVCLGTLDRSGFGPTRQEPTGGFSSPLTGGKPTAPTSAGIVRLSDADRNRMAQRFGGEG